MVELDGAVIGLIQLLDRRGAERPGQVRPEGRGGRARSMRLAAKLGFAEVERFEDYGAQQRFGVWSPATSSR